MDQESYICESKKKNVREWHKKKERERDRERGYTGHYDHPQLHAESLMERFEPEIS